MNTTIWRSLTRDLTIRSEDGLYTLSIKLAGGELKSLAVGSLKGVISHKHEIVKARLSQREEVMRNNISSR